MSPDAEKLIDEKIVSATAFPSISFSASGLMTAPR
jgi:hypothetical protein